MNKKEFNVREALEQLEEIEQYFNSAEFDIEDAITKHQQALQIAKKILDYLSSAETTIKKLDPSFLRSEKIGFIVEDI